MYKFDHSENLSAFDAKSLAQYIAFSPFIFQATVALKDLGILRLIDQHRRDGITQAEIVDQLGISEYGVSVLLDFALTCRLVMLTEGRYTISKVAFFLLHDDMSCVNLAFNQHFCYRGLEGLTEAIKTGRPVGLKVFGDWQTVYPGLTSLPEKASKSWFEFDHFHAENAFASVLERVFRARPRHILDIGGNTGQFALKCLARDPEVKVTIMDLPQQLEVARDNIENAGFASRFTAFPCDMLAPRQALAAEADLIWMSQFLDCFSPAQIHTILRNIAAQMRHNQRLFILELFWDRQKFAAAAFSLNATSLYFACFANGNSRMYAQNDILNLIGQSGLEVCEQTDDVGLGHTLLVCKRV